MILPLMEFAIMAMMVAAAAMAVRSKDLVAGVLMLAFVSLMAALEMFLLRAPDVAMTEAVVGAAITTAMFIFAIRATHRMEGDG